MNTKQQIDDGGPAMPVEVSWTDAGLVGKQTGNTSGMATGLSIRDYFAAMTVGPSADEVLQMLGIEYRDDSAWHGPPTDAEMKTPSLREAWRKLTPEQKAEARARWKFINADAMLAARKTPALSRATT